LFAGQDGMVSCVRNQSALPNVTLTMGFAKDLGSASARWVTMVKTVISVTNYWAAVEMATVKKLSSASVKQAGKGYFALNQFVLRVAT